MALDDGWMKDAACWGSTTPDIFFPESHQGVKTDIREARRICKPCPARINCLFYSIAHDINDGVWGGLSASRRRRLSRDLKERIKRSWFKSHPNSHPMGSVGYFARLDAKRRRGGEEDYDEERQETG